MVPILSLLLVLTLSIIVTRVATVALMHTGLSRSSARFQARSAFTGAGFTTHESERVVNHPVRRRVVMGLMLLGNAGIVTAVSSLILTFVGSGESSVWTKIALLVVGVTALWWTATSQWVDRKVCAAIDWALSRYTDLDLTDYAQLLRVGGEYGVGELPVNADGWLAGRRLETLRLRDEGVAVLAVERADGGFLGVPDGETELTAGDNLIVYGRNESIVDLNQRGRGRNAAEAHEEAVEEHADLKEAEKHKDAQS